MYCKICKTNNVLEITARCKDQVQYHMNGKKLSDGYPTWFGNNDDIEIAVCLSCGQVCDETFPMKLYEEVKITLTSKQWDIIQQLLLELEDERDDRAVHFQTELIIEKV